MKSKNYLIIGLILFCLSCIITALVITNNTVFFDDSIYNFIISFRSDNMTKVMKGITFFAQTKTIVILALLSLLFLLKKYKGTVYLAITLIISTLANSLVKHIIRRERPLHEHLVVENTYSFPSGHAMAAMTFYGFIIFLILKSNLNKTIKIIISILFSLLILLIGISRIYLGVHYPSDIVGGYVISGLILTVSIYFVIKYRRSEL